MRVEKDEVVLKDKDIVRFGTCTLMLRICYEVEYRLCLTRTPVDTSLYDMLVCLWLVVVCGWWLFEVV